MTQERPRISATARLDHNVVAVQSETTVHCMLEFDAAPIPGAVERAPLNLALVLDRSGSMQGPKLEVTKESARFLVRRLTPRDRMALVTFDDAVEVRSPMAPVDVDALLLAISDVHAGGSTNLSGGWLKGVEEVARADGEGPRKVLLLSDGQANVGVVDHDVLATMTRNAREAHRVTTTTIGFGEGFDEDLLSAMADAGTGSAHFIEDPDAAAGVFAAEFEDLAALVAQNVSLEIRPNEQVSMIGILNEFPQGAVVGGVQVALGDAYAHERRRVVFVLEVPALQDLGPTRVADLVLRYVALGPQIESHEVTIPLTVNIVSADDPGLAVADREVTDEVVILRAAKAQSQALEALDRGDFDGARKLLDETAEELERTASGSPQEAELRERATSLRMRSQGLEDPASFDPMARKSLRYEQRQMRSSRFDGDGRRKRR